MRDIVPHIHLSKLTIKGWAVRVQYPTTPSLGMPWYVSIFKNGEEEVAYGPTLRSAMLRAINKAEAVIKKKGMK